MCDEPKVPHRSRPANGEKQNLDNQIVRENVGPLQLEEPLAAISSLNDDELIHACAQSNDGAIWQEFVSSFRRPIALFIVRIACQWGAIPQEVVDDLVLRIAAKALSCVRRRVGGTSLLRAIVAEMMLEAGA
jgi:hypothetical protein